MCNKLGTLGNAVLKFWTHIFGLENTVDCYKYGERKVEKILLISEKVEKSRAYEIFTMAVVILNAVFLGFYTNVQPLSTWEHVVAASEVYFTSFWVFDVVLKLLSKGIKGCIEERWVLFEFVVTALCLLSFVPGVDNFSGIRLLVAVKFFPHIPYFRATEVMLNALYNSLPLLRDIAILFFFFLLFFGILGMDLFGGLLRYRCYDYVA